MGDITFIDALIGVAQTTLFIAASVLIIAVIIGPTAGLIWFVVNKVLDRFHDKNENNC